MSDPDDNDCRELPKRWCPTCGNTGYHSSGCPDEPDLETDDDEQQESDE